VSAGGPGPERTKGRLDQWLWFARFVKSRSLAARLCAPGLVTVTCARASRATPAVRQGGLAVPRQARWPRTAPGVALVPRRGPASQACSLLR